ncbi:MAG TPA: hypothetical protein VGC86_06665, partial [Afipia sp.]
VPSRPAPLARMSFAPEEVATVTPALHDFCQSWITRENLRPSVGFEPIHSDRAMIRFPGGEGGVEWAGGAFDPKLGYYIVNTNNLAYVEKLIQDADGRWSFSSAHFWDKDHNPCQQPPWGQLTAVNVNTGDIAWQIPLGITESLPEGKRETGRPNNGGASLTATGIAFIGGTDDSWFRAFDSHTGKLLWSTKLDHAATASPSIYQTKTGREFVVVTATGGTPLGAPGGGDSLVAFALPR